MKPSISLRTIIFPAGVLLPLLLVVLCASPPLCHGAAASHNITGILAAYPGFAEFSDALSSTGAAAEIDSRNTITVLAVDDAAMAAARGLHPEDLKRAVYLHVLLDYFDEDKLRSIQAGFAQAASLFQTTGKAKESQGIVNITAPQGGRVASFTAGAAPGAVTFYEKSVHKSPYNIAVLQVSALISSPAAAVEPAPVATPRSSSSQGRTAPAQAPAKSAPAPVVAPGTAPATTPTSAPVTAPATTPAKTPTSAPVAAPATAPAKTPAPAPVAAPETAPIPRRRPAPSPEVATAPSPDADDKSPADQKNGGGRGAASWTFGATAAALSAAIVLVL